MSKPTSARTTRRDQCADELLTVAQVAALLGISTKSVARYAADGRLPPPVKVANRFVRWPKYLIDNYLADAIYGGPRSG